MLKCDKSSGIKAWAFALVFFALSDLDSQAGLETLRTLTSAGHEKLENNYLESFGLDLLSGKPEGTAILDGMISLRSFVGE